MQPLPDQGVCFPPALSRGGKRQVLIVAGHISYLLTRIRLQDIPPGRGGRKEERKKRGGGFVGVDLALLGFREGRDRRVCVVVV